METASNRAKTGNFFEQDKGETHFAVSPTIKTIGIPDFFGQATARACLSLSILGGVKLKHYNKETELKVEQLIADEVKRLSQQFGKSFLDCDDIIKITGLGRDNVRALMRSRRFPVTTVGKRQVVSILNFVAWQMNDHSAEDLPYGA